MTNIECELCEIDGKIELCDGTITKLVATGEKDPDVIISYLGMMSHYDAGKVIVKAKIKRDFSLVGREGLEPPTFSV